MFECSLDHATVRHILASKEFVVNVPGSDPDGNEIVMARAVREQSTSDEGAS